MIAIELNNNKFKLKGDLKILNKLYNALKVKHPNQFYIRPHMPRGWDGCIDYITQQGYSKTGLLPRVTSLIEEYNEEYYIEDNRNFLETIKIPRKINDFEARAYQIEAVESIVHNTIGETLFQRGIIDAATNAGKTIIAAMLFKSFKDCKALILINNKPLYEQFMDDMPKFFGDDWGYMQGKSIRWGNIMICMTPTLRLNLTKYHNKLAEFNMVLFDECHLSVSKTNKKILGSLYNTIVRVGLSGTPLSHKDPTKNMDVESFFGSVVYRISNLELMVMGYSTPIVVKIVAGNTLINMPGNYKEEYKYGITRSEEREKILLDRLEYYIKRGKYPILVIGKYHEHVERLYEIINERFGDNLKINFIHHKIKDRKKILDEFKSGKLDLLISSLIIKLGQNIPLIKVMINASSGDSHINALQLIGRAIRTHKSKEKVIYEDFYDKGRYLMRHSKHRIKYYKSEGFKVLELYKKTKK